jgi:hypothetical protein
MGIVRKAQTSFENSGSKNYMKLNEGSNIVRVLPPWSDRGDFFIKVGYHRLPNRIADKVVCPNFTFEQDDCPICKRGRQIYNKYGKDASKIFMPQKRALLNVLDMKKADGVVYVMDCGSSIINPILNFMNEMNDDSLLDPEQGFNVSIKRRNESGFTKYDVMVMPKPYGLSANGYDVNNILSNLNDLATMIQTPEPDDFYDILDGLNQKAMKTVEGDDADEDQVQSQPAPQKKQGYVQQPTAPAGPATPSSPHVAKPQPAPLAIEDDDSDLQPTAPMQVAPQPAVQQPVQQPAPVAPQPVGQPTMQQQQPQPVGQQNNGISDNDPLEVGDIEDFDGDIPF